MAGLALAFPAGAEEPLPPSPAEAPPQPADLSVVPSPAPAAGPAGPTLQGLPAGLEALPAGGARLRFQPGVEVLPQGLDSGLAELGRRIAAGPPGRIAVTAQASGPASDVSAARRVSLARALAVKQALAAGGLPPTRIDIRPMGRTAEALDAVDVQPPEPKAAR
ncbi:OmpA family protein [Belnapia rosea]|uniref:hypothetical protein n=1 Tax=Belnapia rosea TaxID=938405 RepID=UPI0015A071F2|nr:hypothetical protein [Belnapia rosea]